MEELLREILAEIKFFNKEYMSVKEIGEYLGFGETTIYDMAKKKEIPAIYLRGKWVFSKKQIDEFLHDKNNNSSNIAQIHKCDLSIFNYK